MQGHNPPEGAANGSLTEHFRQWRKENPEAAAERERGREAARRHQKLVATLTSLFTDGDVERAYEVVIETLKATMTVVLPAVKGKPPEVLRVPDHRMRLEAAKFVAAYTEGLPIARQINLTTDFKEFDVERLEMLASMPALQEALLELEKDCQKLKMAHG